MKEPGTSAVARAKKLAAAAAHHKDASPLDMAEALWKADQEKPGSLKEIVNNTSLGRRRAFYLLKIWRRFAALDIERSLLVDVGWQKLAVIANCSTPGDESAWLYFAPGYTARELEKVIRGGEMGKVKDRIIQLHLDPDQHQVFATVLLKYGATNAKNGKGIAGKEQALTAALGAILDHQAC